MIIAMFSVGTRDEMPAEDRPALFNPLDLVPKGAQRDGEICVKSPGGNGNDTFLWGTTVFASVRCRRGINLGRSFTMGSRSNMAGEGCRHKNSRASEMRALCYADGIPPTRCACPTATWESTRRTRSVRSSACATRVPRVPDARHRLRILTTRLTLTTHRTNRRHAL